MKTRNGLSFLVRDLDTDWEVECTLTSERPTPLLLCRFAESLATGGMTISNDLVLSGAGLRQVSGIVRERQLRVYQHVARLSAENSAHEILSGRDPTGWTMPEGHPHSSWLRQLESCLRYTGMAGPESAWGWADGDRRISFARWMRGDAAAAYVPIPDLSWI